MTVMLRTAGDPRALAEPAFAEYDKNAHKLAQERLTALGADKVPAGKKTP